MSVLLTVMMISWSRKNRSNVQATDTDSSCGTRKAVLSQSRAGDTVHVVEQQALGKGHCCCSLPRYSGNKM